MKNHTFRFLSVTLLVLVMALGASSSVFGAATIVILNNDPAGVGFNDPTVVPPVGGNNGTTLGQQRLNVFQAAAGIWGATLTSSVTITIRAQWTALTCTATTAVLGSAGAVTIQKDFANAPFAGTWYCEALADKLSGTNIAPDPEINANFNINLGQTGCLDGVFFYLGLDGIHGANVDLEAVLLHEFGHGLGFQTFTNGATGAQSGGFPSIYDRFLLNAGTGKSWLQMTNAERVASAVNVHKLAWDGPQVSADVAGVTLFGVPILTVNSPPPIAGDYAVSTANFGASVPVAGVTGNIIQALDEANKTGPTTFDGCTAFTNAAAISGNIALVDRGVCTFETKTLNAQNAGAIGLVIVNNVAGAPPQMADDPLINDPITIAAVQITMSDGDLIKAQLGTGVNGTMRVDLTAGDPFGKALLFSPSPFQSGSSVSHFDNIAFPNLLMEPAINGDLTHNVTTPSDLTFSEMRDIGWLATSLPNTIATTTGNDQSTLLNTPFAIPFAVTISPAVAGLTVTFTANASAGGANGTFAGTGTRFATATTNAAGLATAPVFTANGIAGDYAMNATVPGAGTTAFSLHNIDGSATPTPTPTATGTPGGTPTATPTGTPGATATPSPTATPPTGVAQAINLSTRLQVQGGDNVGIGGFIITGTAPKQVLLRGIGPSLTAFGVPNALADPVMELHGTAPFATVTNDNWRDTQEAAIIATHIPPTDNLESAILATLDPGAYTAVVRGQNNGSGVALIEVYDLSLAVASKLGDIATRAFVNTGNDIVIAGFILGNGSDDDTIVVRGIGPSLTAFGVPNALANPTLELRNSSGALLMSDDDWQDDAAQAAQLTAFNLAPTNALESGIVATLGPGAYTALLAGVNNGTGVGLVEVYDNPVAGPTATPGTPTPTPPPGGTPTPTPTPPPVACTENFDGVSAPALPAGWAATNPDPGDGVLFVTSTATPDTAPNAAFIPDQDGISDKVLDSRPITINSATAQISFRNNFDTEFSDGIFWDGGVLEVSSPNISGGAFLDVTDPAVGGSIVTGGYTGLISSKASNPLAGRMAWSSSSGGYINTVANLGPNVNGQTITLRFRFGSDEAVEAPGWNFDTISITGGSCP